MKILTHLSKEKINSIVELEKSYNFISVTCNDYVIIPLCEPSAHFLYLIHYFIPFFGGKSCS